MGVANRGQLILDPIRGRLDRAPVWMGQQDIVGCEQEHVRVLAQRNGADEGGQFLEVEITAVPRNKTRPQMPIISFDW
jgi:hypothetical protein